MKNLPKLALLAVALTFAGTAAQADPHKDESGHHRGHAASYAAHGHGHKAAAHGHGHKAGKHYRKWQRKRHKRHAKAHRALRRHHVRAHGHWRERPLRRYLRRLPAETYIYVDLRL